MPNKRTDSRGAVSNNQDIERDIAAKGGPALGTGNPDDAHGISHPYDEDLQTQIAAKSRKKEPLAKPAKMPVK